VIRLEQAVTCAIVANTAVFVWGLVDHQHTEQTEMAEQILLAAFTCEMSWKIWTQRTGYFTRPWQVLDLLVILVSLAPMVPSLAVLRLARLARLAKVLHMARHAVHLRLVTTRWRLRAT
jgi:hypothetical protein